MESKHYPIEYIIWYDAYTVAPEAKWADIESFLEEYTSDEHLNSMEMLTVGFVLHEDEKYITVASTYNSVQNEVGGECWRIPVKWIKSRVRK